MAIVYPQFPRLADIGGIVSREFNSGMEMGRESLGVDAFGRYLDVQGRQQASPQLMQAPAAAAPMSLAALGNQAMGAPVQPVQRAPLGAIGSPSAGTQPRLPDPATARVQQAHSPRESLIQNESGGRWDARNNATGAGGKKGHFGRVQFGHARLEDAKRAGAIPANMTPEQFMASPDAQIAAEQWHFADIDRQAQAKGLTAYMGQNIGGVTITPDAIRAMAHLGGIGGAERFIKSGGRYNPADENGTRLSDYGQRHGGQTSQAALESMSVGQQMPAQGQQFAQMGGGGFPQMQPRQPVQLPPREVMMDLFRSPATRPLAMHLVQAQQSGQQIEQYQTFQREDGSIWQMNTQTGQMQVLQKPSTADGGTEYGLTPQFGTDENGNPVLIQLGKDGSAIRTPLPEGVQLSTGIERHDLGDRVIFRDRRSGEVVGTEMKGGSPSADQMPTGDGGLQAIPGSTLDVERTTAAQEAERRRIGRQSEIQRAGQTVLRSVNRGLEYLPQLTQGEGIIGSNARAAKSGVRGTPEYNLKLQVADMLSNVGLDRLQQMRDNSPTGGALGQVPIQQQQRLEQVLGSFDLSQDPAIIEENLKQVNNIYIDVMFGSRQERELAVREGRMTPEQNAEIDQMYYEVGFDQYGRRVGSGGANRTSSGVQWSIEE